MKDRIEVDVLVVGAGPVGMLTALRLSRGGARVRIIDEAPHTATHSHACILHSESLRLLAAEGLKAELTASGRPIGMMGMYDGAARMADVQLDMAADSFGQVMALPQSSLEDFLETQLQRAGVTVAWNHRLERLHVGAEGVLATVSRLTESAKGYIIPEWEWVVDETFEVEAKYLIGADGRNSSVRRSLGWKFESVSQPKRFVVFEAVIEGGKADEIRVGFDEAGVNAFYWPLPGKRCRLAFRVEGGDMSPPPYEKERQNVWVVRRGENEEQIQQLRQLSLKMAPWFEAAVEELDWVAEVEFAPGRSQSFGDGCCWLVGDAAHVGWPAGVQSMNSGLREAVVVGNGIKGLLSRNTTVDALKAASMEFVREWECLLRPNPVRAIDGAKPWVEAHATHLPSCLPATGPALSGLLGQLRLAWV